MNKKEVPDEVVYPDLIIDDHIATTPALLQDWSEKHKFNKYLHPDGMFYRVPQEIQDNPEKFREYCQKHNLSRGNTSIPSNIVQDKKKWEQWRKDHNVTFSVLKRKIWNNFFFETKI